MKKAQFRKQQSGFTLIELVVVIVILGILAATAIPRFTGMQKDAREAAVSGMMAAVQSAAAIAHAQALVKNVDTGNITLEGATVALVNGYPSTAAIADALSGYQGFTFTAATGKFTLDGSPTVADCSVTYTQAAAGAAPTIAKTVSGC